MESNLFLNALHYRSGDSLFVILDTDDELILQVDGVELQEHIISLIESLQPISDIKKIADYILHATGTSLKNLPPLKLNNLKGELTIASLEEDFIVHDIKAYAKFTSSQPCPGSAGGMTSGPTLADDLACML